MGATLNMAASAHARLEPEHSQAGGCAGLTLFSASTVSRMSTLAVLVLSMALAGATASAPPYSALLPCATHDESTAPDQLPPNAGARYTAPAVPPAVLLRRVQLPNRTPVVVAYTAPPPCPAEL